jgi:hypothetical protein
MGAARPGMPLRGCARRTGLESPYRTPFPGGTPTRYNFLSFFCLLENRGRRAGRLRECHYKEATNDKDIPFGHRGLFDHKRVHPGDPHVGRARRAGAERYRATR